MKKALFLLIGVLLLQAIPMNAAEPMEMHRFPASFNSPMAKGYEDYELITKVPAGEKNYYNKLSAGYLMDWNMFREHTTDCGAEIVFTQDGEVYFDNFLSNLVSPAWIKGSLSDDGKSIRVDFPQDYYTLTVGDTQYWGSLNRGSLLLSQESVEAIVDTENNYVTFTINEDGSIDMEDDVEILLMWSDGTFSGYSDNIQQYLPIEAPLNIPEGVKTEEWVFLYGNTGCFVEIGEEDNQIYIKGFSELFPDATMVGEVKDNSVIEVAANQFMGLYETQPIYLMFGGYDDQWQLKLMDSDEKYVFNYDHEAREITAANAETMLLLCPDQTNYSYVVYLEAMYNPSFKYQGEVAPVAPMAPELSYYDDSQFNEFGESYLWFSLPPFNVNGDLINTNDCYYTIYIDNEPYIFYGDMYPVLGEMGIDEITDIPYNMDLGSGLAVMGIYRGVVLLCGDMDRIDVQSYLVVDGEKYYSDKMTVSFSGIESVDGDSQVMYTEYYDLTGAKVNAERKGIVICKTIMSDGTVRVSKQIR